MVWEIDSRQWHLDPDDYTRTLDRRSALMAAGAVVLHTQPQKLHQRQREAQAELIATHAAAARRPRPPIKAVPGRVSRAVNGTFTAPDAVKVPFAPHLAGTCRRRTGPATSTGER